MPRWLWLVLASTLAASSAQAQVTVSGNIAANTTWGPTGVPAGTIYWVTSSISVNSGVTLTIQPGVIVKFNGSTAMTVNGTLNANGTALGNIIFTSIKDDVGGDTNADGNATLPAVNDWRGITFPDAATDLSVINYGDIRFCGSSSTAAVTYASNSSTLSNSVVRRSYYGIDCAGTAAPNITSTSIEASTQTPIVLDFTAAPVLSSLVFSSSNNGYDAFGLRGGTLAGTATLPIRGATVGADPISNVTYVLLAPLTINVGASLTIAPGVVIKPLSGSITVNGNLTMNGTVTDTITITSIHDDNFGHPQDTNNNGSLTAPARGNWSQVVFAPGATGSVQYARLKFGTNSASQGLVEMRNLSVPVSNCLLSDAGHGIALFGVSNPACTNLDIRNCSSTPILMSVSANPTFTNISFLANALTAIGLQGETIGVNSTLLPRNVGGFTNITYIVMNASITMQSPAVLTISPGLVIKFNGCLAILVDGALVADATPATTITFTSIKDDQYGNPADTNGDGSLTTPGTGDWGYIRYRATSDDAISRLNNCRLLFGSSDCSSAQPATVWITSAAPTITNCFISKALYGVRFDGNATGTVDHCDIENCSNQPFIMSVLSDPVMTNNVFASNVYNAIGLLPEVLSQNALLKPRPTVPGGGAPPYAYMPTGTIGVASGVTLAIAPQVVLKPWSAFTLFDVDGALNVIGSDNTTGRVVITSRRDDNPAYGGDSSPNDATGPQGGDWGNITFSDISVDAQCVLRNVLFQFGGSGGNTSGTIFTTSAGPKLARLEFFQCVTALVFAGPSTTSCDSLTILNCTQLPIVASLISNPTYANITMANNAYTCLGIIGETIAQDVTLNVRSIAGIANITYCPTSTITIAFGSKWTIAPGVVIKLGRSSIDPIGIQINIDGALVADGTPANPIVFTSSADDSLGGDLKGDGATTTPAVGQWNNIYFSPISNDALNLLDNCLLRYGGNSLAVVRCNGSAPTISNCTFVKNNEGLYMEGGAAPVLTNCWIASSTDVPVKMSLVSSPVFNNVQFVGNAYTALGVIPETIAQDFLWPIRAVSGKPNMPYLMSGTLTIGLGSTMTLQPGLRVKFLGGSGILVQRAFIAEGRTNPESTIVFTSSRDDFYGGDTNNDGSVSSPTAADWTYITIDGTAIDLQCRFKNCIFRYGGNTSSGALRAFNSSPSADSCIFSSNATGISAEGSSNPTAHRCSFFGNTTNAINNSGASFCVNADSCWWGSATGPNDNSATVDLCAMGTNAGTGDHVSNNVHYLPFATSGLQSVLVGDVSLNGQVLAYDASLVLQYTVSAITLSPTQLLAADVSFNAGVTAFDASLILQYVARLIPGFRMHAGDPEAPAVRDVIRRAEGTFAVALGEATREGDDWIVPVHVTGSAPIYSVELALQGAAAQDLSQATSSPSALVQLRAGDGTARVAVASAAAIDGAPVATLRFHSPAGAGADWSPPALTFARVNENLVPLGSGPVSTTTTSFAHPTPNPTVGDVSLALTLSSRDAEAGVSVRVLDLSGRMVRTLADRSLEAGRRVLVWDLRDEHGRRVPAGVYLMQARAGAASATRRVVVVR